MPEGPTLSPRYPTGLRRALIIGSATMAAVMVAVDSTIANVALSHMQSSMSASQDQVVWVLTSYMIASAIATPLSGWMANRFGRKRVMVLAVIGFTLASMLCGMAVSLPMMVAARMLQGVCGAALIPLNQALLLDITPPEQVGRAMAINGIGIMFGPLIGPTLGGFLIDTLNWRWVFFINVPLGIVALAGMVLFMTETNEPSTRFDYFGFASLSLFLGTLQLMLDRGPQLDWLDSREIRVEAAAVALFAWMTVVHMVTAANSFVRPQVFLDRNFSIGCLLGALTGIISFASVPLLTIMIQQSLGYPAMATGLISSPRGFGTLASMLVVGRLIGRYDSRIFLMAGIALNGVGLFMLSRLTLMTGAGPIMSAGLMHGLGSGLIMVPLSTMVFSTLSPVYRNEGTALYALTRTMGNSLGISVIQMQTVHAAARVQSRLMEGVRPDNPMMAMRMPDMDFGSVRSVASMVGLVRQQASMVATVDIFWLLCLVAVGMMPLVLTLRPPPHLFGKTA